MERIFPLGANRWAGPADRPWASRFETVGFNTGNLLIGNGLHRQLQCTRWGGASIANPPAFIKKNFDRIVLPAANFLCRNFDFTSWADFVESVDLPCLMAGLGAQAPDDKNPVADIPKGTVRFVKAVAERSRSIGVRGHFTAEVLDSLGIANVDILGCPSLYTNLSQPLRVTKRDFSEMRKIVLNGSSDVIAHACDPGLAKQVERRFFRMADARNLPYVLQSEWPEISYLKKANAGGEAALRRSADLLGYADAKAYAAALRRIGRVFFDVQEWFDWMRGQHLSLGTRLHGAVAALLQGVPAILICHDARTKEVCELMHLPQITLAEARALPLREIYERADFDGACRRHARMLERYVAFLEKNGACHRFQPPAALPEPRPSDLHALRTNQR